jgi:hypothetical protein
MCRETAIPKMAHFMAVCGEMINTTWTQTTQKAVTPDVRLVPEAFCQPLFAQKHDARLSSRDSLTPPALVIN